MKSACAASLLLLVATTATAHHSTTAYDHSRLIELSGTVTEFQWTNPHSWIQLTVTDANGNSTEWAIETGAPNLNIRHGWKRNDLKPGDRVSLTLYPNRNGLPNGTLSTITLPDGRVLDGAADFVRKDIARELGGTPANAPQEVSPAQGAAVPTPAE